MLELLGIILIANLGVWFRFKHNTNVKERVITMFLLNVCLVVGLFRILISEVI